MTERLHLIALQDIDTAIDQLRIRIDKLPERSAVQAATDAVAAVRRTRAEAEAEIAAAEAGLARTEADSAEIDVHRARLQAQMKTIISPREAEALQKEMGTLSSRRDELDDRGLEFLETVSAAQERIDVADATEPGLVEEQAAAQAALDAVAGELTAEVDALTVRRDATVADIPAPVVTRYERMRTLHGSHAVARLVGHQCTGCHLELSLAEAEAIRHVPDDEVPDCPSCGRVLIP